MKKYLIVLVCLSVLLVSVPAFAASSCCCVGANGSKGSCGHGGVAGSFMDVRKHLPDDLMKYILLTQSLRDKLSAYGKAYDSTSGWACWKE